MALQIHHCICKFLLLIKQFFLRASDLIIQCVNPDFHLLYCPIQTVNLILLASDTVVENQHAIQIRFDILIDNCYLLLRLLALLLCSCLLVLQLCLLIDGLGCFRCGLLGGCSSFLRCCGFLGCSCFLCSSCLLGSCSFPRLGKTILS